MKKSLTGVIIGLVIFLLTGFVIGGKSKWEYKVAFLMPEERVRFYAQALQEWEELGIESKEFRDFCEKFYPQGLTPERELEALRSFKEFELERIKKKGVPSLSDQQEFLNNLQEEDWEIIAVATQGGSGLPVGYFKRKGRDKEGKEKKEDTEPVSPFNFPTRERGY